MYLRGFINFIDTYIYVQSHWMNEMVTTRLLFPMEQMCIHLHIQWIMILIHSLLDDGISEFPKYIFIYIFQFNQFNRIRWREWNQNETFTLLLYWILDIAHYYTMHVWMVRPGHGCINAFSIWFIYWVTCFYYRMAFPFLDLKEPKERNKKWKRSIRPRWWYSII